jgi:uncharacterized protein YecE (DUF72 family)
VPQDRGGAHELAGAGQGRELRIGCSGWNYKHWRNGVFYPPRLAPRNWLAYYSAYFDTVEINATFYRLPTVNAVRGWETGSPEGFVFAVKMSRYITHIKRLTGLEDGLQRFYARIAPFVGSPKFGPVLWQLAPNFHRDDERLAAALELLPAGRHAFEFRHASWFHDDVYALLRGRGAALVIGDDPRRPYQTRELTADFTFVRFHAGAEGGNGNYSYGELERWARWIEEARASVDVYAYFNNDWEGYAIYNGLWLKRRLGVAAPPHPAEPPEQR